MNKYCLRALGIMLAFATSPAMAVDFMGDQIKVGWRLPNETSPFPINLSTGPILTVGEGVDAFAEISNIQFLIDFSAHALDIIFPDQELFAGHKFNGLVMEQLTDGSFGEIVSVTGIDSARVKNVGNTLSINFSGLHPKAGDRMSIVFVADAVPEPATWAMMIAGMAMVGGALRLRRAPARLRAA